MKIDAVNFDATRFVDRSFEEGMTGLEVKDQKGIKIGKILGSQFNMGTLLVDIPRLFKNGPEAKYYLDDKQVIIWQPAWLKLQEAQQAPEEPLNEEEEEMKKELQGAKVQQGERRPGHDPILDRK